MSPSGTLIEKLSKIDWVTNLIPELCQITNFRLIDEAGAHISQSKIIFGSNYELIHTNMMLLTDMKMRIVIESAFETVMTNIFTYTTKLPKSEDYFKQSQIYSNTVDGTSHSVIEMVTCLLADVGKK